MKTILFQGDSITDSGRNFNCDHYPGSGYATVVNALLGSESPGEYQFLNRGISGNRIVDVYARIKSDIINLKPDYMSLLIGVNDVWHELSFQNGVSAEKFERVYDMLLTELHEELPDCKIMLLEPFILEAGATCANEENPGRWAYFSTEVPKRAAAVRRLADKHHLPYVPLQQAFTAACEKAPADYWLFDGVHPTPAGHGLLAKLWLDAFRRHFG